MDIAYGAPRADAAAIADHGIRELRINAGENMRDLQGHANLLADLMRQATQKKWISTKKEEIAVASDRASIPVQCCAPQGSGQICCSAAPDLGFYEVEVEITIAIAFEKGPRDEESMI
ncbi:hypothetical protein A0H81_12066 [Grifola frondosa]|uniref:Uncharacterized protein n=1 Tax=Grifola frondosa TaxID=5627 RepID=A0A1C7LTN3_GRIFR|nr:hypothetical protein A0H81_12066 [Grifola frondosa]